MRGYGISRLRDHPVITEPATATLSRRYVATVIVPKGRGVTSKKKKLSTIPGSSPRVLESTTFGGSRQSAPSPPPPSSAPVVPRPQHARPAYTMRLLLLIWLVFICASAAINWSDGQFSSRTFIDYDDHHVITPMLKLNWSEYWLHWFPDRTNYAFPIRDLTLFIDQLLEPLVTPGVFWVSQFLFHAAAMFFVLLTFNRILGPSRRLVLACFAIVIFHNFNTEVLQWLTCRKYVVSAVPLALGSYLVSRWYGEPWKHRRAMILLGLWVVALGAYPTSALWIFWAFGALWIGHRSPLFKIQIMWLGLASACCIVYLAFVGRGTGEVGTGLLTVLQNPLKTWTFGTAALGRGYWNLLFPFSLAPFYDEQKILTSMGLVLFGLSLLLFIVRIARTSLWNRNGDLTKALVWLSLGLLLLIPTFNTILSFHDFMLADRHLYLSLPWFTMCFALFHRSRRSDTESSRKRDVKGLAGISMALTGLWICLSIRSSFIYVPQWRNALTLMEECAFREQSPRCHSQAVRRHFFQNTCHLSAPLLESASQRYAESPPFALEFQTEIPFYHGTCLALSSIRTSEQKISSIHELLPVYGHSAGITLALILVHLEKGDLPGALGLASRYSMGSLENGRIVATTTLLSIYDGHLQVLCQRDHSGLCQTAHQRFQELHPESTAPGAAREWGQKLTELMIARSTIGAQP